MASGLFDDHGGSDPTLTGVECRILRAMLSLERRHVAILAEIVRPDERIATDRVTQWERSTGRGYPPALVVLLRDLADEVRGAGHALGNLTVIQPDGRWVIARPGRGEMERALTAALMRPLTTAESLALDDGGGDFWQRLSDVAVIEAARLGQDMDMSVHVSAGS